MKLTGGLNRDNDAFSQPEGSYTFAKNATLSESLGSLENLPIDELLAGSAGVDDLQTDEIFLGSVMARDYLFMFTFGPIGPAGVYESRIYSINTTSTTPTYTVIAKDLFNLNPSPGAPGDNFQNGGTLLEIEKNAYFDGGASVWRAKKLGLIWRTNENDEDLIVITGDFKPKIINITEIFNRVSEAPAGAKYLSANYTKKDLYLSPEGNMYPMTAQERFDGGSVLSGAWMFTYRYEYEDGSNTDWAQFSNTVYVSKANYGFSIYNSSDIPRFTEALSCRGDEGNNRTEMSIKLDFSLDHEQPVDSFIRIGYISIRAGVTYSGMLSKKSFKSIERPNIGNQPGRIFYSGEAPEIDFGDDISSLITPQFHFKTSQAVTSLSDRLYVGNFESKDIIDYQTRANEITVKWSLNDRTDNNSKNKGLHITSPIFGAGEAYAFYIHLRYKDGTLSRGFHVPGRKMVVGFVHKIVVTAGGAGYSTAPVAITGAGGSDATAIALIEGGAVTAVYITNRGFDYTSVTVTITGDGAGATATGTLAGEDDTFKSDYKLFQIEDTCTRDTVAPADLTTGGMGYWRNASEEYPVTSDFPDESAGGLDDGIADESGNVIASLTRNVRHHRFPSYGWLLRESNISGQNITHEDQPRMSAIFDGIEFTKAELELIEGYHITYAKKGIGDIINIAYDWPTVYSQKLSRGTNVADQLIASAGNWNFTCESGAGGNPISAEDLLISENVLKYHALHLLENEPSVNPKFIAVEQRFSISPAANAYFAGDSDKYQRTGFVVNDVAYPNTSASRDDYAVPFAYKYASFNQSDLSDPTTLTPGADAPYGTQAEIDEESFPVAESRFFEVYDDLYIRTGVKTTIRTSSSEISIDNTVGENAYAISAQAGVLKTTSYVPYRFGPSTNANKNARIAFTSLRAVPSNVSYPFTNQTLIHAGYQDVTQGNIADPMNTVVSQLAIDVIEGDFFNGQYQFNTTGVSGTEGDEATGGARVNLSSINSTTDQAAKLFGEGAKMVYSLPVQSPINHGLQEVDENNVQSHVYPIYGNVGESIVGTGSLGYDKTYIEVFKSWYFYDQDITAQFKHIYNNDFHRRNEYVIWGINDGIENRISNYPYSIQFTNREILNDGKTQWRSWPMLNRYTMSPDKGIIVNLQGAGNNFLYIHQKNSLFITKDRLALKGTSDITLGSSDIFSVTPSEIIATTEGHTGLRNKAWANFNPMGYTWINNDSGKVFLHDGSSIKEISSDGMRTFFRDYSRIDALTNNEVYDYQYSLVYDELRKNLLVCSRLSSNFMFTLTYSSMNNKWVSFHTRQFSFPIVAANKEIYAVTTNAFQPSNGIFDFERLYAGGYANSEDNPFIIEMRLPIDDVNSGYLQSLEWATEMFDSGQVTPANRGIEVNDTFNKALIFSNIKSSGLTDLVKHVSLSAPGNIRRVENNWFYNNFRNIALDAQNFTNQLLGTDFSPENNGINNGLTWSDKPRMNDRFFHVRLKFIPDKVGGLVVNFDTFKVSSITTKYKKSRR